MKQLMAFMKKEWMEILRTGKFTVVLVVCVLFGVMNPAIAKLIPWMIKSFSEDFENMGLVATDVTVDAITSWTQFYKNIPMLLVIFLLMFSGILVNEYQKGTLINMLTKGLSRWKVIGAKGLVLFVIWTLGYWICFGITWCYNAYFWDNGIAEHVVLPAGCFYLLGVWLISLLLAASVLFSTSSSVCVGTGVFFFILYAAGFFPKMEKYLPVKLADGMALVTGVLEGKEYLPAAGITLALTAGNLLLAIILFNRKNV